MSEINFLYMHKGVLEHVKSKESFQRILGLLKVSNFVRKQAKIQIEEPIPDDFVPEASRSQEPTPVVKKRRKRTVKGKSKVKQSQDSGTTVLSEGSQTIVTDSGVKVVMPAGTLTLSTQTDEDFQNFITMSNEEYEEYIAYKHLQLSQQHLVNDIVEQDFSDYDEEQAV